MPHTGPILPDGPYAVVSCHVEQPLDDAVWARFSRLQEGAPFRVAALMRPPADGEDEGRWLDRARAAAVRGPLGHHTHFGGSRQARPTGEGAADLVRSEGAWLRESGLRPTLFCGGAWYLDAEVARAVADLGYADCSATAFRPTYLAPGSPRVGLDRPAWLALGGGTRLLELPSTHSLGMLARAVPGRLPQRVHAYFHDTDLIHPRRRAALVVALHLLARRRPVTDLDRLADAARIGAPEVPWAVAATVE